MLNLKKKTADMLSDAIKSGFGEGLLTSDEIFSMLEYPPDKNMGDLALPCFKLSKSLRRSPVQIASALAEAVKCEEFSSVSAMGGYLNFKISPKAFADRVIGTVIKEGNTYGASDEGVGKTFPHRTSRYYRYRTLAQASSRVRRL